MNLIATSFLDKCVDLLSKVFSSQWVIAAICLGGFALAYLVCLLPALLGGDFIKSRKAVKMIASGEVESGLLRLKKRAPSYDKKQNSVPPPGAFDYDKIIAHPHSYSFIKKLPVLTIGLALFFAALAMAASVAAEGELNGFAALMLLAVAAFGLLMLVVSALISGESLRRASKSYHAMIDYIKDITAAEVVVEKPLDTQAAKPIEESIDEICLVIERIALTGGADHMILKNLYTQITALIEKAPSPALAQRLVAAMDVLDLLIDSAMQK